MQIDWARYRVRLNSAGRVRCEPPWRLDRAWASRFKDHDLWFVWAGRGWMRINDTLQIDLHPGLAIWVRQGTTYEAEQDVNDRLGVSYIHFDLVDEDGAIRAHTERQPPQHFEAPDLQHADVTTRRIADLVRGVEPTRATIRAGWSISEGDRRLPAIHVATNLLNGLLMDLDLHSSTSHPQTAGGISGTPQHHQRLMQQVASQVSETPHAPHRVAELARQAGYSADHFARVFKAHLGMSPQDYVVQARINRARMLLAESALTISQVAASLGYRDVFFFSRQFKAKTGVTPSQWRRSG